MVRHMMHLVRVSVFMFFAWTHSQSQTILEIQGGANFAKLSDPGNLTSGTLWKTRVGFIDGISTMYHVSDRVIINPGIRYNQKGVSSEWTSSSFGDVKATLTNEYLEIPLYVKYAFAFNEAQLFILGGPSLSYLITSTQTANTSLMGSISDDSKEDYRSYDITCDIVLSSMIPIHDNINIIATVLYSYGLVHVSRLGSDEATRDMIVMIGSAFTIK